MAAFSAAAWLAVRYRHDLAGRIGLAVLLALMIAGALYALAIKGHGADALAVAGAVAMTITGFGLSLVAAAVAVGCVTHVAGDMLTEEGRPLLYPALFAGLGLLVYRAVSIGMLRLKL